MVKAHFECDTGNTRVFVRTDEVLQPATTYRVVLTGAIRSQVWLPALSYPLLPTTWTFRTTAPPKVVETIPAAEAKTGPLDQTKIEAFASAMRERLRGTDPQFRKSYVRLFVSEGAVADHQVTIKGPKAAILDRWNHAGLHQPRIVPRCHRGQGIAHGMRRAIAVGITQPERWNHHSMPIHCGHSRRGLVDRCGASTRLKDFR